MEYTIHSAEMLFTGSSASNTQAARAAIRLVIFSLCSMRASDPLKSKRVETSLLVWSIALLTSAWSASETMSNEGVAGAIILMLAGRLSSHIR
jgi:hypothetical protein